MPVQCTLDHGVILGYPRHLRKEKTKFMTVKYKQQELFYFLRCLQWVGTPAPFLPNPQYFIIAPFLSPLTTSLSEAGGEIENHVTHINLGRHERNDMRDSDFLNYLYGKNEKERKGDGSPTKPSILYQRRVPVIYPTFL